MMIGKRQRSGDESLNIQADSITINSGLSASDVISLVRSEVRPYFDELSAVAREVAESRAAEIAEAVIHRIAKDNPGGLAEAEDPDFQYALIVAQREYARTGNEDLKGMLIDLLVARSAATCNLERIVLAEAMDTSSKLSAEHLNYLTLYWQITSVRKLGVRQRAHLITAIENEWKPFLECGALASSGKILAHLVYCRCMQQGVVKSKPMAQLMIANYPGLFFAGLSHAELRQLESLHEGLSLSPFFIPCLNDADKLQIAQLTLEEFEASVASHLDAEAIANLRKALESSLMSPDEVDELLRGESETYGRAAEWYESQLRSSITTVGTALAHSNWCRLTGQKADLTIWL